MPGLADAPLEWHKEHKTVLIETGFAESHVAKALYLCVRLVPPGAPSLEGVLGSHVDDDIMAGSDWFEENIVPPLRRRFHFGGWAAGSFVHTSLKIEQDSVTSHIKALQRDLRDGADARLRWC